MSKLAPDGYGRSPAWQRQLIERAAKRIMRRQSELSRQADLSFGTARKAKTINLGAIGIAPDAVAHMQADEERIAKTLNSFSSFDENARQSTVGLSSTMRTAWQKALGERNNQVHYYIRAIQMEQLQQQDLTADMQQINDEISNAVKETQGANGVNELRSKMDKQVAIVKHRCAQLASKASKTAAANSAIRKKINDLRLEKQTHRVTVDRLRAKAAKMDDDIAFLTHSAHVALDQREKVKIKFMAAQRDMQQEREQKFAMIKELMQRASTLDDEWGLREEQLAEAEEARRRRIYADARHRRNQLEAAETRFGFLSNQVQGWDSEFERLQSFTRMDSKFEPGQKHIVEEITSRFLEKERTNTSLLRFLHEQESELTSLRDELRTLQRAKAELHDLLASKAEDDGAAAVDDPEALANASAERRMQVEALLDEATQYIQRIAKSMWKGGSVPTQLSAESTIAHLESWMKLLDARVMQVRDSSLSLLAQVDSQLSPILTEWCEAQPEKFHATVPEIHDTLVMQATHRRQRVGGDVDDEDEDEAERAREKQSKLTPFSRVRIDPAKERQKITEWARKRQVRPSANTLSSLQSTIRD